MPRLTELILEHAKTLPEGELVTAKGLLHLGKRAAVDQALSRLANRGQLIRAERGVYLCPVDGRFGIRSPGVGMVVEAYTRQRGEAITPAAGSALNVLGLSTQNPVRSIFLTSGRSRRLKLGRLVVEFRHAPRWQLVLPGTVAGNVVRALAFLGAGKARRTLKKLKRKGTLTPESIRELAAMAPQLPAWMSRSICEAAYG